MSETHNTLPGIDVTAFSVVVTVTGQTHSSVQLVPNSTVSRLTQLNKKKHPPQNLLNLLNTLTNTC